MCLVCLHWANKSKDWLSMGLQAKHHDTEVDHDPTLTEAMDSSCTWTRESSPVQEF